MPTDHTHGINRREFVIGSGSAGIASLAGCSESSDNEEVDSVQMWHTQTAQERRDEYDEIFNDFTNQTGIEVETNVFDTDEFQTQYQTARNVDDLPGVAMTSQTPFEFLRGTDVMNEEVATNVIDSVGEDQFADGLLDAVQTPGGDEYFAVPIYAWFMGPFYFESVLEEQGLPTPPRTWEEIYETAEALHNPDDNVWGWAGGTEAGDAFAQECYTSFALSNNAYLFDEDGDIMFDSDEHIETLEYYSQLAEFGAPGDDTFNTFGSETYFVHTVPHQIPHMWENLENPAQAMDDLRIGGFVENERQSTFGAFVSLASFDTVGPSEEQAAEQLIEFHFDEDNYVDLLHMQVGGHQPIIEGISESEQYREHEIVNALPDVVLDEQIPEAMDNFERFGYRDGEFNEEVGEIMGRFYISDAIARVVEGESPSTVAAETQEEMENAIS